MVEVTFKYPVVMVNVLAIPNTALADNLRYEPLIVMLYKLAVPDKEEEPVNVAIPADAEKPPLTFNNTEIEKLVAVEMIPEESKVLKPIKPLPLIVLEAPAIVMVPVLAEKDPETDKLPLIMNVDVVATVPLTERSLKTMLAPVIVFVVPVIFIKPPDPWLNWPDPVVAIFPDTFKVVPAAAVIPEAAMIILLKFSEPDPLILVVGPENEIVLVLPVNAPLFTQLPATLCVKVAPSKEVATPIVTFLLKAILEAAP